jgi:LPXTG-motif cell wall-anchored protein
MMTILKASKMNQKIIMGVIATFIIIVFVFINTAFALKNPSAVYCEQMGYEWTVQETKAGQIGICKFSKTEDCPAWEFLKGKCGEEHSFCIKEGYELKNINDQEKCSSIPFSSECAVCVLANGEEIEVTKLMELDFKEAICGDGKCVLGENYKTCPEDCSSGLFDGYCDGEIDAICDPDCTLESDLDCAKKPVKANIIICADKNCSQKKSAFTKNETVYFKINSDISNLNISSTVKIPSGEIKYLTFEDNLASFQSNEIGDFSLWINLSKRNYQNLKIEENFVYLAKIPSASICNGNGKCEGEENEQNCPQDCLPKTAGENNNKLYILIAGILLVVGVGIAFVLKRKRKKTEKYPY